MSNSKAFLRFSLLCLLGIWVTACGTTPPVGNDDDVGDDDDASDDDDSTDPGSYPGEESFLALAVGNFWRYDEVYSGGPDPVEDDVQIEIVDVIAGPDLVPPLGPEVVAFEFEVDRLFGRDETHWYTIDGSGRMLWLKSEVADGFFETVEYLGAGEVVMWSAEDELGILGSSMESVWFMPDIEGIELRAEAETVETYFYGDDQEIESLGVVIYDEGSTMVGLQYFKPEWGVLAMSIDLGSSTVNWTITECSVCPASAGL